jgi:type IV pilus assembly protein PilY1
MAHLHRPNFQYSLLAAAVFGVWSANAIPASLALSPAPLFVTTAAKANVLLIFSNGNNMDEDPTGLAVGSANPASKSEIARSAARSLVANYTGKINMGLMAYQQKPFNSSPTANSDNYTVPQWLNQSPYDASYDSTNYVPTYAGSRVSTTKKYRTPNLSSSGDYVYYNVNLPFYSSGPSGSLFCYSATSTFDNGPGSNNYACYSVKTGTSDAAPGAGGDGYSSYYSSYSFGPTDSDLAQNISFFGTRLVSFDVGPTWFSNRSPGLGYLHVPIASLDTTQAGKLNTKLATSVVPTYNGSTYNTNPTSISGGNTPTNPNAPLQNAGLSPITGTFLTANDYFNGATFNFGTSQGGAAVAPPSSCNKDFAVFLTNGLPNVTSSGGAVTYASGSPYSPSEVANSVTAVGNLNSGSRPVKTYVIGFALPQFTQDYFTANPPNPLDQMAAAGGTATAYYANNLSSLNSTFSSIFNNILAQSGSAAAVALTSGSVVAGGKIYQGQFNSADWSGDLVAFNINAVTGAPTTVAWNAATQLNTQNYSTGRNIISFKPSTSTGIPFRWPANPSTPTSTELDVTQVSALNTSPTGTVDTNGASRLNYVRGDTSQSGVRGRPVTVLGDIVDSAPFYVGVPASNYSDVLESAPYSSFRSSNSGRSAMIYVGANDGMLHGFDAGTGNEKLAYVPSQVYPKLTQLTSSTYAHNYFVDGSPTVLDGFYNSAWHTVLVSGLAGGGQGYFALDVTDPSTFSEANAATLARWEFTDTQDADLGYSFSQPSIVKLNNGRWAAIFGNGYNNTDADGHPSTTGHAVLFIVDLETGALIKKIDTGYGTTTTPNGLATPTVVDQDGNSTADVVYAGDLAGNLWKFDISASSASSWGSAYVSGSSPTPLFVAKDASNNRQPITAAPDVVAHPSGTSFGWMVMFGTGKYLETGDPATTSSQTFYGIQDNGAAVANASLVQQTVTSTVTASGQTFRTLSANAVNWAGGTVHGWYLNLPTSGERVVSESSTDSRRVIFTTVIPSTAACSTGGTGWLMEVDLSTGGTLSGPNLDVNGDGTIDSSDYVSSPGTYPSGVMQNAIPSAVRLQTNAGGGGGSNDSLLKRLSLSDKTISTVKNPPPTKVGRSTWREIIQ